MKKGFLLLLVLVLVIGPAFSSRAVVVPISTLAGSPGAGSSNGVGATASFSGPLAVALDGAGNAYVADTANHTIRMISPAGNVTTLAGIAGSPGSLDGTGSNARFNQPSGIAVDSLTNIYVADTGNHTIRKITVGGVVTTVAGTAGVLGTNNAIGILASFNQPMGLAVDTGNNLYIADYGNHLIRKMTPAFSVSTFAGTAGVFGYANGTPGVLYSPEAVAVDSFGNVFVADTGNAAIRKITSAGAVSLFAGIPGALGSQNSGGGGANALFYQPAGVAVDSGGSVFASDYFNQTIRKITSGGVVSTLAGVPGAPGSTDGTNSQARFFGPQGLAINASGTIYVADSGNSTIRTVTSSGLVSTVGGSSSVGAANGPGQLARFFSPQAIAIDSSGNLYIADAQNSTIRKITFSGVVSVLAGSPGVFGSADGTGSNAQFAGPQGIALDSSGNVYVADTGNDAIRKITSGGLVSTLAGLAGRPGNADGLGTNAQFSGPIGIAVDTANNVYVADTGNHTIRKITPAGLVTALAGSAGYFGSADGATNNARFNQPVGIAVDGSGNLYVTDYNNNTIRQVTSAGVVTTIAGYAGIWGSTDGSNNAALFSGPTGIAVDFSGALHITDSRNHTIRNLVRFGQDWVSATIAGTAGAAGSSDGVNASARFYYPCSIAANSSGYLFIVDSGNNLIRTSEGVPIVTWAAPSPITYGTALSSTQLNATANAPGAISYAPASGTVLDSGANTLLATFAPTDPSNTRGASASVTLSVLPASLTVTANNARRATNTPNPIFTGVISGIQNSDSISASYNSSATPASPAGSYPIVPSLIDPNHRATNYNVTLVNGTLTIVVPPSVQSESWSNNKFTFTFSSTSNQMYQIQYCTNLALNNWFDLGAPVTATNSLTTVSDTNSAPFRLYRLTLYP